MRVQGPENLASRWVNRIGATLLVLGCDKGALVIRIGFGVYSTTVIIRTPENPILISKAPTV